MRSVANTLVGCLCWVCLQTAYAQALHDRFAPGSIDSIDRANAALAAAAQERAKSDADYAAGQKACYQKFFANACIDQLNTRHRAEEAEIGGVELEARRYQRAAHDAQVQADRSKKEQNSVQNAPSDAALREQNRAAFEKKQADAKSSAQKTHQRSTKDSSHAAAYTSKVQSAAQQKASHDAKAQGDLTKGEHNARELTKKEDEAAQRREHFAKKHREKEAERAKKAAEKQKKEAGLPAAPVSKTPEVLPY